MDEIGLAFHLQQMARLFHQLVQRQMNFMPRNRKSIQFIRETGFGQLEVGRVAGDDIDGIRFDEAGHLIHIRVQKGNLLLQLIQLDCPAGHIH